MRRPSSAASGKVINFHGFLKAYVEGSDDPDAELDDNQRRLPPLAERDPLAALNLAAADHATRPPARYTEATLIKELEDRAIGRPSTYASIIGTILDRGYVFKKGTALVPSFVAFAVVTLLERHFAQLVDYAFTARMEDALDDIASGEAERVPWLRRFYFGADGEEGLKEMVSDLSDIDARDVSSFPLAGTDIVVRVGRYGPYLERDGQRVNVPEGTAPDELTPDYAAELLDRPSGDKILGSDPETGKTIVAKAGRFGPYVTEVLEDDAPQVGQAAHRVAAEVDGPGQRHARGRAPAADAAAHARRAGRGAGHRAERPVRSVREEGRREPVAGVRRADVHGHHGRGEGTARSAQAARPGGQGRGRAAAEGAGRRLGEREADRAARGPVRPVRDRRRDERVAAQGRHDRVDHAAARDRAARRATGRGAGAQAKAGNEVDRDPVGQTGRGQEADRHEGRRSKAGAAKNGTARSAAAKAGARASGAAKKAAAGDEQDS